MDTVIAVVVRIVALGAALAAYYAALPHLFPDEGGGANIGAGLIAFAGLMATSFVWSLFDGARRGISPAIVVWAIVAVVFSVGWLVARAVVEADASMSATEIIRFDLATLPFTVGLVLVPAAVGAAIGGALRPSQAR